MGLDRHANFEREMMHLTSLLAKMSPVTLPGAVNSHMHDHLRALRAVNCEDASATFYGRLLSSKLFFIGLCAAVAATAIICGGH
jgi:hypothetical protein